MTTPSLFPANRNEASNKLEWLQDVASLIEPDARERFLLRVATFQQVNPRDPLFATLDAMGLLTLAFQKVPGQIAKSVAEARSISEHVATSVAASKEAAAEMQRLAEQAHATMQHLKDEIQQQGQITIEATRQALEDMRQEVSSNFSSDNVVKAYAASKEAAVEMQKVVEQAQATMQQLKAEIQRQGEITIEATRQALEDMRHEVSANLSSENVVDAYEEATRKRFAEVIDRTVQPAITKSTTLITNRLENWAEGVLDQQLTKMTGAVNATLASVTRDFRVRLYGAWSGLLWAMLGGGVIAALILFMAGYYLGEH